MLEQYTRKSIRGPGEIKRREVSRTLTKKVRVSFAGPGEIKRREVVLDPQESPEEIKSREVELGSESWTSFVSVISQQRSNGYCPCVCSAHQLKQHLRSTLVAARWRGPHCLNIVVVLAVVHSLFGLPFTLFLPLPLPLPPSVPVPISPL